MARRKKSRLTAVAIVIGRAAAHAEVRARQAKKAAAKARRRAGKAARQARRRWKRR